MTKLENCSLCLKPIDGKPIYIDKYPHHQTCSERVERYLKGDNSSTYKLCKFCNDVKISPKTGTRDYCTSCGMERGLPT